MFWRIFLEIRLLQLSKQKWQLKMPIVMKYQWRRAVLKGVFSWDFKNIDKQCKNCAGSFETNSLRKLILLQNISIYGNTLTVWMKFHKNALFFSNTNKAQSVYADLEPQFTLKNEEGEKLVYQCNICKPKPSVISVNIKSRSNLKRHLTAKHQKTVKLVSYELNHFCHFVHGLFHVMTLFIILSNKGTYV